MKDKWIYLAAFFLLAPAIGNADGQNVEQSLIDFVTSNYNLDTSKTTVEIDRFSMPAALVSYDSLEIIPLSSAPARGAIPLQINFFDSGNRIGRTQARISVSYFDNVLTAVTRIKRGEALCPEQFLLQRQDITSLSEKPLSSLDSLSDLSTRRNINIGQVLLENMVEATPDIKTGQELQIKYQSGPMTVSVTGVALSDGHIGGTIKVRNRQSGKSIKAVVTDNRSVSIAQN